jgi:hypothetical protein
MWKGEHYAEYKARYFVSCHIGVSIWLRGPTAIG